MSFRSQKEENRMKRIEERKKEKEEQQNKAQKAKNKNRLSNYLIVFLAVAVIAAYAYISSNSSASEAAYYPAADNDPSIGPVSAPVEIIAFGDMECPYTKNWVETTFEPLLKKYGGKIRFVYRDFPKYDKHRQAQKAAEAAECANDQGKYWDYFRKIFRVQPALSADSLKQYAVELGLDSAKFNECLDSGKYADEVKKDHSDGEKAGVVTTPTFFINGNKIAGDQKLDAFDTVIGQLLK